MKDDNWHPDRKRTPLVEMTKKRYNELLAFETENANLKDALKQIHALVDYDSDIACLCRKELEK